MMWNAPVYFTIDVGGWYRSWGTFLDAWTEAVRRPGAEVYRFDVDQRVVVAKVAVLR
jgi:hypothetical protein